MNAKNLLTTLFLIISSFGYTQTVGSFHTGNVTTYLPDGSGQNYNLSLVVSGFPNLTITSPSDLSMICVDIEHSYLGDLEMWLTAPNGAQVILFNAYNGANGQFPGGFGGGGTFLGEADDTGSGTPGIGYQYCFSSTYNTWGTMAQENTSNNTIPTTGVSSGNSMNPNGVYLINSTTNNLVGSPINGTWTLFIRDNLAIDDGFCFGWGIELAPSLFSHNGHIYKDFNQNCTKDSLENGVENLNVLINPGNYIAQTNSYGIWHIDSLPIGTYTVTIDTTTLWARTCPSTSTTFTISDPNIFVEAPSIGVLNQNSCSAPNTSIFMPVARPCMQSTLYATIENNANSTDIIQNAYAIIELDSLITLASANGNTYTFLGNHLYQFTLGDLYPGEVRTIELTVAISCQATMQQTLCNKINLFPVESCMLDTLPGNMSNTPLINGGFIPPCILPWDSSSIAVSGWCENDSIYFNITNNASALTGNMQCYTPLKIYVDSILSITDSIKLNGGESQTLTYPANGKTWRIYVDQHPLHPGNSNPTAFVELCGNISNWTPNMINAFPEDDSDPTVDVHCLQVTASYDPNDKRGYPLGFSEEHYIKPNEQLEYVIRFQNTGTDTAFTVVIRDTLDFNLDIFSINSGNASHPYTYRLTNQNVLEWTFSNILLPDSNTNEIESKGFITFSVNQKPNLSNGVVINNNADIYFDFNLPIITNETKHTINLESLYILNLEEYNNINQNQLFIYPNPTSSNITLEITKELIGKHYTIFNIDGKIISRNQIKEINTRINLDIYESGLYFIKVGDSDHNTLKIIKQ